MSLQIGGATGRATSADDETGGVAERRRFAPSPPCLVLGSPPPSSAHQLSDAPDERRKELLPSMATAVDAVHRFRVAHGSLGYDVLFADGATVWIAGVEAHWKENDGRLSPRQRDLDWFRGECERFLGPSLQPGVGSTCRGMLAGWREAPPPPKPVKSSRRNQPPKPVAERIGVRRRPPWRTIGVVGLVVILVAGMSVWAFTPLPTYAARSARWAFRQLPASLRARLDPDGRLDPTAVRAPNRESPQDKMERLELSLSELRPDAIVGVLTEPGAEYDALLKKFLKANDAGFNEQLALTFSRAAAWNEKSLPRLRELLADREAIPAAGVRTLEHCFLRAARKEELPEVRKMLAAPSQPATAADAYAALARLEQPAPIAELEAACDAAGESAAGRYIATVFYYYSEADALRFLAKFAVSPHRKSYADAWSEVLDVVLRLAPRYQAQAAAIFEKVLHQFLPKILDQSGDAADADLLLTMLCLWRLQTVSPEDLLARMSAPTAPSARISSRLRAMLIGSATESPPRLTLPDGWEIPDEWYGAVLAASDHYPAPFVQEAFTRTPPRLTRLQQQSRLLSLANLADEASRGALADDVAKRLARYRETWRTNQPYLISTSCALLTAARHPVGDAAAAAYFAPGPLGREHEAWDGLLLGAALDPKRHRTLLRAAAQHPLPTFWTRARDLLALADGDAAAFRNPDRRPPTLPAPLASLVAQLEKTRSEADVDVLLSRQRDGALADMALGLSASPGAVGVLHARMGRVESLLTAHLLLANQPVPYDPNHFAVFFKKGEYQLWDSSVMLGLVLRDDLTHLAALRAIAVPPRGSRTTPPVVHRAVAMYALGALQPGTAAPATVNEILSVVHRDASPIVRCAAAAAALKCVRTEDKKILLDFLAARPKLPEAIAAVLRLADKL